MWRDFQAENTVRACLAQARTKGRDPIGYAQGMVKAWGHGPAAVLKRAVTPDNTTDDAALVQQSQLEYVNLVTPLSLIGRAGFVQGVRNATYVDCDDNGTAYWVPENSLKTPTALRFNKRGRMGDYKVVGFAIITDELANAAGNAGALYLRNALSNACRLALDAALCDPANAGDDGKPPSIAYGAPAVASTGNPATDLQAAFALLAHPANAVIACNPQDAVKLAGYAAANGAPLFPDAGPRGGVIWGAPFFTSDGIPEGNVLVFDPSQIPVLNDGPAIDYASEASMDMGNGTLRNLWQTNMHGWRIELFPSWLPPPDGAVAVITGFGVAAAARTKAAK